MHIKEVNGQTDIKQFLDLPLKIYKDNPNWIRPLDKDIEQVFDPAVNKFFRHGACKRWLLLGDRDAVIGRIAAFINKRYKQDQPTGGIGFFECINDQAAAHFMFDHCRKWLQEQGMEAMDGPINFGERDRWWGLLVEGFHEPLYGMNYHQPYYRELFESYGFKPYFHQLCFARKAHALFQKKFYHRHAALAADPDYKAVHIRKKELTAFAKDFCRIYNKAWGRHGGGKQLDERQAIRIFNEMKPVLDEHIIWFVYYRDEPIACWLNLPDLNQFFKHLNGKFGFWQKLQFFWLKKFGKCDRVVGIVFGVVPEFQRKGVDNYMIIEGSAGIRAMAGYKHYEMQWIGDFNPKMINVAESLETYQSRKLTTYRYLFDRNKEFKRHPILK